MTRTLNVHGGKLMSPGEDDLGVELFTKGSQKRLALSTFGEQQGCPDSRDTQSIENDQEGNEYRSLLKLSQEFIVQLLTHGQHDPTEIQVLARQQWLARRGRCTLSAHAGVVSQGLG